MRQFAVLAVALLTFVLLPAQDQREYRRPQGPGRYNIAQACSDRAQLNTLAFDALGFLTGDLCGSTFLPPGKVCDYFGLQYLRHIDTGTSGHKTDFLTLLDLKDYPCRGAYLYSEPIPKPEFPHADALFKAASAR